MGGPSYLTRIEHAQNMRRFYRMDVQPTLFGEFALVREWGRIGQPGQVLAQVFPDQAAAEAAQARLIREKLGRGYTSQALH